MVDLKFRKEMTQVGGNVGILFPAVFTNYLNIKKGDLFEIDMKEVDGEEFVTLKRIEKDEEVEKNEDE